MPPKSKKVHHTRSVSGARSRSNSPLVVNVSNDLVKAKQPKQAKAKLKSIVKVVTNNDVQATKRVTFRQGPAPPVDHQPASQPPEPQRQTAFADAMAKWKLSMVATINPQVTRITRARRAMVNLFRQARQWFRRGAGLIRYRRQYTVHLLWWLLGAVTAELVQGIASKIAMIFHSRFHQAMMNRTFRMLRRIWRWILMIIPHRLQWGDPIAVLGLLHLHPRGL